MSSDLVYDNHVDMIDSDVAETDFAMASDLIYDNHVKVINLELSNADMLAEELESKVQIKGETDDQHIRGIPILDLMDKSQAIRIPWTCRDRIIFASHAARHKLNKGTLGMLYVDELIDRLGFRPFLSGTYRDVLVPKLTSALDYLLKALYEKGHVIYRARKPYSTMWKPHTTVWGQEDWDGNMSGPSATPTQHVGFMPTMSGAIPDRDIRPQDSASDNIYDATPPPTPSPQRFRSSDEIPQLITPLQLPKAFQRPPPTDTFRSCTARQEHLSTPLPTPAFQERSSTWLRKVKNDLHLSDLFMARKQSSGYRVKRRPPRPAPIPVPSRPTPRHSNLVEFSPPGTRRPTTPILPMVPQTPCDHSNRRMTRPGTSLSIPLALPTDPQTPHHGDIAEIPPPTRYTVIRQEPPPGRPILQPQTLPSTLHAIPPETPHTLRLTHPHSGANLESTIMRISLLTAWLHFNKYAPSLEAPRREIRLELEGLVEKYPRSAFATMMWRFSGGLVVI